MKKLIARFAECESGATAIEYSLLAGVIAIVIITAGGPVADGITAVFGRIQTELDTAASS